MNNSTSAPRGIRHSARVTPEQTIINALASRTGMLLDETWAGMLLDSVAKRLPGFGAERRSEAIGLLYEAVMGLSESQVRAIAAADSPERMAHIALRRDARDLGRGQGFDGWTEQAARIVADATGRPVSALTPDEVRAVPELEALAARRGVSVEALVAPLLAARTRTASLDDVEVAGAGDPAETFRPSDYGVPAEHVAFVEAIVTHGGVSAAARAVGIDQVAAQKALRHLRQVPGLEAALRAG
jgi:hypothetical protein